MSWCARKSKSEPDGVTLSSKPKVPESFRAAMMRTPQQLRRIKHKLNKVTFKMSQSPFMFNFAKKKKKKAEFNSSILFLPI